MKQIIESFDLSTKISDKIAQIEQRNRRFFTNKEKEIAFEMFLSGFLFSQQWNGNEFAVK